LSIEDERVGDRHTLLLTGELDIASAPELEEQAQRLCARPASELVLDLSRRAHRLGWPERDPQSQGAVPRARVRVLPHAR